MKCEIILDPTCQERVVVYAKENSPLLEEIRALAEQAGVALLGKRNGMLARLNLLDIDYIAVWDGKVYAVSGKEQYLLRERLYTLEQRLPESFVKINQSCLANIQKMVRFDTSLSGTMKIFFQNGHSDYVSRRQLKTIKERLGI